MGKWSLNFSDGILQRWPMTDNGHFVPPAHLAHISGDSVYAEGLQSKLNTFDVASICRFPNVAEIGQQLANRLHGGVDIFVPTTLLEKAKSILSAEIEEDKVKNKNEFENYDDFMDMMRAQDEFYSINDFDYYGDEDDPDGEDEEYDEDEFDEDELDDDFCEDIDNPSDFEEPDDDDN